MIAYYYGIQWAWTENNKHVALSKKNRHITPLTPHNGHLSTMATFFSSQGSHYGDVRLYTFVSF